jgi:TfoX/Sxy family transcriptional regulator of competence genes
MSRDMTKAEIPAEKMELYEKLIRERPHIDRKGVGLPYTSMNGHMFSFLSAGGSLALRLPAEKREEFLSKHKASLFVAHGAVLKEYVEVPEKLFRNTAELLPYLDMSYEYVQSLKPKLQKKGSPKKSPPKKSPLKKGPRKKTP